MTLPNMYMLMLYHNYYFLPYILQEQLRSPEDYFSPRFELIFFEYPNT